jgi:hypothetical protein
MEALPGLDEEVVAAVKERLWGGLDEAAADGVADDAIAAWVGEAGDEGLCSRVRPLLLPGPLWLTVGGLRILWAAPMSSCARCGCGGSVRVVRRATRFRWRARWYGAEGKGRCNEKNGVLGAQVGSGESGRGLRKAREPESGRAEHGIDVTETAYAVEC